MYALMASTSTLIMTDVNPVKKDAPNVQVTIVVKTLIFVKL